MEIVFFAPAAAPVTSPPHDRGGGVFDSDQSTRVMGLACFARTSTGRHSGMCCHINRFADGLKIVVLTKYT